MNKIKSIYQWYALYVRPNGEKKVQMALKEKDIEVYLPLKKSLRIWSDRKKWIEEPLFKGYVFVRVSHVEYFNALNTTGVVCYVSFGGVPQSIPEFQINNIRTLIAQESSDVVITRERIRKGLSAEVLYGALKGVRGEVIEINGQCRILIRVDMMNYSMYANISKDEVKILEHPMNSDSRLLKQSSKPKVYIQSN